MSTIPGALLLTPEGDIVEISLPADQEERQAVMRSVIRCDRYDVVALTTRLDMWLDDEGIYNHPVNKAASLLACRYGFTWQNYHGPVLLTGGPDGDGDTLPLNRDQLLAVLKGIHDAVS